MGFFSDIFGGGRKPDIGAAYPDYPDLKVDDADLFLQQVDGLVKRYEDISTGKDMFDAIKFIYEPQKQLIDAEYGIGGPAGDVFSSKSGALAQLQAGLNKRGLLDTGTSGLLESQLYANRARDLANLFGESKQIQKQDIDNALVNLQGLYPQRFDVRNIQNAVDYMNAVNQFNYTDAPRASAQAAYNASQGPKTFLGQVLPQLFQAGAQAFGGQAGQQAAQALAPGGQRPNVSPNLFNKTQSYQSSYSPSQFAFTQGTGATPFSGGGYSPMFDGVGPWAKQSQQPQRSEIFNTGMGGIGAGASFATLLKQLMREVNSHGYFR